MRAAVFDTATRRLEVQSVADPQPGPGEVVVEVQACGICLSDVHLIDGTLASPLERVTPGHEPAGVIAATGSEVPAHWRAGMRVLMAAGRPCGQCVNCLRGYPASSCLATQIMGFAFDGAWAEYVVVPWQALTAVPDHVPIEQAAILADAVSTPYAGLTERAGLRRGESIGLWGIGGLGVHAVLIARLVGASPIIAFDPSPAARQRALDRGADHALDPTDENLVAQVWELTGGLGLDVAADLFGANRVLKQANQCLGRYGRLLIIGLTPEPIELGPNVLFGVTSHTLLGHLGYDKKHLDELMALVASGRLDVSGSISDVMPLDDVAHGVAQLASKAGDPIRLIVAP
ncbi:MAG TPA: alcohol dehydrogenase catalytic domain-containing protein [Solirubrobacteraceae bacterium]|nr:alcohol dehydrogenase catalytic domain-containing protein [Solirubrobacteraceae bacterium]